MTHQHGGTDAPECTTCTSTNGVSPLNAARLLGALDGFTEGEAWARQEIEAAIEVLLRGVEPIGRVRIDLIRTALHDPHGALAAHDEAIRAEHTDDLIDHLRKYPNVRIASNGSWVGDAHERSSGE